MNFNKGYSLLFILLLFVQAGASFYHWSQKSVFDDEAAMILNMRNGDYFPAKAGYPAGIFALLDVSESIGEFFGYQKDKILPYRFLSHFFIILNFVVVMMLGFQVIRSVRYRIIFLFLFSINPLFLLWAGAANYYVYLAFCSNLMIFCLVRHYISGRDKYLVFAVAALVAGIWVHFLAFSLVPIFLAFLYSRAKQVKQKLLSIRFVTSLFAILIFSLPLLFYLFHDSDAFKNISNLWGLVISTIRGIYVLVLGESVFPWSYLLVVPAIIFSVYFIVSVLRYLFLVQDGIEKLLVLSFVLAFISSVFLPWQWVGMAQGRYFIGCAAIFTLVIVIYIKNIVRILKNFALLTLSLLFVVSSFNVITGTGYHKQGLLYDWNEFEKVISSVMKGSDTIDIVSFGIPQIGFLYNNDDNVNLHEAGSFTEADDERLQDIVADIRASNAGVIVTARVTSFARSLGYKSVNEALIKELGNLYPIAYNINLFEDLNYAIWSRLIGKQMEPYRLELTVLSKE